MQLYDYEIRVKYDKELNEFYLALNQWHTEEWKRIKFFHGELIDIFYHKPYLDFIFEFIHKDIKYSIKLNLMSNMSWSRELLCLAPNMSGDVYCYLYCRAEKGHKPLTVFKVVSGRVWIQKVEYESIPKNLIKFYNMVYDKDLILV